MDIQALKKDILHRLLEVESEELLIEISELLNIKKNDFWDDLTKGQKNEVELGLKQIDNGETEDWEDFLKRVL